MDIKGLSADAVRSFVPQSAPRTPPDKQVQQEPVRQAARSVNRAGPESEAEPAQRPGRSTADSLGADRTGVKMRVDDSIDRVITQIMDQNNEVLKQIPPEEVVKLLSRIRQVQGLMFDELA